MTDFLGNFNASVNTTLDPLFNDNIRPFIMLFLTVYGSLAAPGMPAPVQSVVGTIWFKIIYLSLLVWIANKDPGIAIAATIAFIGILNVSSNRGLFETFEGPTTAIYPGCMNLTVFDLLESFNNDKEALMNAMLVARVPGDVTVTDYYAPLIGTYLLNKGFVLKSPCSPPTVDQNIGI
jgi:hypothetical protein